jgi:putative PEP-CTERM system TPR-repeat lipoprotein
MLLTGTVYYAKEEFEQAAYYLGKYVSARPEDLRARKLLGRTFIALEQHDKAESALRSALDESNDDAELLALVGLSALRSGQSQAGILELEKAVSLSPQSSVLRGELARAYMSTGDTELAITELEKIIAGGKDAYRAQVMVVFAYLQDKKYEKARESAQAILEQYPDDAPIINLMGIVQHASGDLPLARQYFEKAVEVDPKHTGAAINLARLDEKAGDLDGAIKRYRAIIEVEPANKTALMSLSRLALAQNDKVEQMQWLEKVRATDKKDVASRVVLIEHYIQNKKLTEAERLIKELEAEHAGKPVLLVVKAELLITRESYNQAVTVINELITSNPDAAIGHYLKGLNQVKMGQVDDAKSSLLKAYELEPNNLFNTILLAQVRLGDGEFEQALILAEQVKKMAPARTSGFEIKGDANAGLQKYHQALQEYDAAWKIEQSNRLVLKRFQVTRKISSNKQSYAVINDWLASHPNDYLLRFKLAESYQVDGLFEEAIDEYKRVLDAQPENVFVLNNLAWLLNNQSDSQALVYAEKAFKLNQSAAIKDTYGWVLLKNKKTQQALTLLSEAVEELSHIPDVKYHYAMALYETGDKQQAYTRLEALLASKSDFEGRADARRLIKNKE